MSVIPAARAVTVLGLSINAKFPGSLLVMVATQNGKLAVFNGCVAVDNPC